MSTSKGDGKKARYWQQILGEAARSGLSIREFCRRRRLKESQFYSPAGHQITADALYVDAFLSEARYSLPRTGAEIHYRRDILIPKVKARKSRVWPKQ